VKILVSNDDGFRAEGIRRLRLRDSQYAERAPELNRRAAQLAREAADDRVLVAGSMGPTGMLMEPFGELTHEACVETYAEQASALTEGGVDFLLLETFFALEEATAAIEGVKRASDLPLVVSFSYDQGTVDLGTGVVSVDYQGQICTPRALEIVAG